VIKIEVCDQKICNPKAAKLTRGKCEEEIPLLTD